MENKNKNLIIIGAVALVAILVVVIIIVLNNKPEESKIETNPKPENGQTETLDVYKGTLNGNGYTIKNLKKPLFNKLEGSTIENLKIDGERVISSQSSILLTYATLEEYKTGKEGEYPGKVIYNDDYLSIEYTVGEELDYTKNAEGEEVTLNFSEFRKSLEELGYTCSKNS